jgi:hypothetical protein
MLLQPGHKTVIKISAGVGNVFWDFLMSSGQATSTARSFLLGHRRLATFSPLSTSNPCCSLLLQPGHKPVIKISAGVGNVFWDFHLSSGQASTARSFLLGHRRLATFSPLSTSNPCCSLLGAHSTSATYWRG